MSNERVKRRTDTIYELIFDEHDTVVGHKERPILTSPTPTPSPEHRISNSDNLRRDGELSGTDGMSRRAVLVTAGALALGTAGLAIGVRTIPGLRRSHEHAPPAAWEYTVKSSDESVSNIIFTLYPDLSDETIDEIVYTRVVIRRGGDPNDIENDINNIKQGDVLVIDYPKPETIPTTEPES